MSVSGTNYSGSVSKSAIYQITQGEGFTWAPYVKTEVLVDGKPRQLTRAKHNGDPLVANIKNPRDSDFTTNAQGYTIDGRTLEVTPLMAMELLDVKDLQETFPRFQPSGMSADLKANPEIASTVFDLLIEAVQTQMNILHSSGTTLYDGFETKIIADANCVNVGTNAALTAGNIISRVLELRDAIPPRLRRKAIKIFCSYADADLFDYTARTNNTADVIVNAQGVRNITQQNGSSIPIIPVEGLSKDFMFATVADRTDKSNLVQGVWMDRDSEAMKMYRSEEGDQIWKLLMRMDLGVQYKESSDIFYIEGA